VIKEDDPMKYLRLMNVPLMAVLILVLVVAGCSQQSTPESAEDLSPVATEEETAQAVTETGAESTPAPVPAPAPAPPEAQTQAYQGGTAGKSTKPPAAIQAEPEPEPEPVIVTLPAGTVLNVAFQDGVASNTSMVGDSFRARVISDVAHDGAVVVPAGSVVVGTVTEAVPLKKKIGGRAKLALEFTSLELTSGRTATIAASFAEAGKSETKKDAATIGGAAAGGALLGRLLKDKKKDKGTLIGAVVGAAAGTAIAAKTEGEEVEIPAGTEISLALTDVAHIPMTP
jgi:hypothetical protein